MTDPIADYLTRLRNAIKARHRVVEIPSSKIKKEMTRVLYEKGFIQSYKYDNSEGQGVIKVALKYNPITKLSSMIHMERVSKPGLRKYVKANELPRVLNGLGIAIISTSSGLITDKEAKELGVGGEVLCYIY
jgi:small subunit ribosomal protein S8